ncbi:patatin-like phospholipase family protein [Marivirga sp. S37H4]|uniref:Patatin-like phospholipase family protein n=1 Tax=Marivirga aurantiaca TaxID=2802615 RepID=A0A934WXI2_9BACT|nr:patatin-like phospholipase family protein [Marivirga aurantiaca]MBK6264661.1 patatin-like phospholipase family protein [Marivirga aurantiaca]
MKRIFEIFSNSFPIRLLIIHFKKNQVLLLCWLLLFLIINGSFARGLGIPYLFLSPEYLNEVSYLSFLIVGLTLGGLIVAFNIASYILDGPRFQFIGAISKPFSNFSLNNSLIPLAFLINYIIQIVNYQMLYEFMSLFDALLLASALPLGVILSILTLQVYFWFTNKDVRDVLAERVEKRIRKLTVARIVAVKRHKSIKNNKIKISGYFDFRFGWRKLDKKNKGHLALIVSSIFNQNHLNTVIAELFIFALILLLGVFREYPVFQIPAAASTILFITIILMFIGAITFWFRGWAITVSLALFFVINFLVTLDFLSKEHYAHGLNYKTEPVVYNIENIQRLSSKKIIQEDKQTTLGILENWRSKFDHKPKMILLTASGGGQRAAYWTMHALQQLDSATSGRMFDHTVSITGASGGLIGAAYFRELKYQEKVNSGLSPYRREFLNNIGQEALNPIIFSLLTNDIFIRYQKFKYGGYSYPKDRGYAFEQKLNRNTEGILNKKLIDYRTLELNADIPILFLAPTSVNDGRKLYITPHSVSYMAENPYKSDSLEIMFQSRSIDFLRTFEEQDSKNLSFLTALRMSASFPYITPNVNLPSNPSLEIMDAGLADNFGISDAVLFLYNFQGWIKENTSGVIILSIRDSRKAAIIEQKENLSITDKIFTPITNIYNNWSKIQDGRNDLLVEYAREWYEGDLQHLWISYDADMEINNEKVSDLVHIEERASLSWRLTGREKFNIRNAIWAEENQRVIKFLYQELGD